jgi:hypothetical protein
MAADHGGQDNPTMYSIRAAFPQNALLTYTGNR